MVSVSERLAGPPGLFESDDAGLLSVDRSVLHVYNVDIGIHTGSVMRTNIDIDDELIAEAMEATGLTTKKATVEEALRRLVRRYKRQRAFADMTGLGWEGNLDATREGRGFGQDP
jgi:Arc/MetJ family transcription regulator